MRVFQLFKAADLFLKRLAQVEDAMEDIRRLVRNQDLDVSDALEKIQRLTARLAKRAERLEEPQPSRPGDETRADSGGPERQQLLNKQILARRRVPPLPTDGL